MHMLLTRVYLNNTRNSGGGGQVGGFGRIHFKRLYKCTQTRGNSGHDKGRENPPLSLQLKKNCPWEYPVFQV